MSININGYPEAGLMYTYKKISDELFSDNLYENIDEMIVYVINTSLACEIGLKGLLRKNIGDKEINGHAFGHDLKKLFDALMKKQKKYIMTKMKKNKKVANFNNDFNITLKQIKNNFVKWRYYYDLDNNDELITNCPFLNDFLDAIISLWENYYVNVDDNEDLAKVELMEPFNDYDAGTKGFIIIKYPKQKNKVDKEKEIEEFEIKLISEGKETIERIQKEYLKFSK